MIEIPKNCDICGKSFRGHDPLTDGKRFFHTKCAPKPDWAGMRKAIQAFFKPHGIEGFTTERRKGNQ